MPGRRSRRDAYSSPTRGGSRATAPSSARWRSTSGPARCSGRRNGRPTTAGCSSCTPSVHARHRPSMAIASTCSARPGTCSPSTSRPAASCGRRTSSPTTTRPFRPGARAGAPLVDGDRLICLVGGEPNGKLIALDKRTGKEMWRCAVVGYRTRLQPADHHRSRRRAAADPLPSRRVQLARSRRPARCSGRSSIACRWASSSPRRCAAARTCSSRRSTAGRGCFGSTLQSRRRQRSVERTRRAGCRDDARHARTR